MNNLATRQAEVGCSAQALASAQEAVSLGREPLRLDRGTVLPVLAKRCPTSPSTWTGRRISSPQCSGGRRPVAGLAGQDPDRSAVFFHRSTDLLSALD